MSSVGDSVPQQEAINAILDHNEAEALVLACQGELGQVDAALERVVTANGELDTLRYGFRRPYEIDSLIVQEARSSSAIEIW